VRTLLDPLYKALGALGALFILATLVIEVVNIVGREVGYSMAASTPTPATRWRQARSWRWPPRCATATTSASPC